MNVANTTPASYNSLPYRHEDYFEANEPQRDKFTEIVWVVPPRVYIGVIYFVFIFGLIGNACILALMRAQDFRHLSYSVYLRFLAIWDSLLLVHTCISDILDVHFGLFSKFELWSEALCKFWSYFGAVVGLNSIWLLLALTFDRFVAVVFPFKRAMFCSHRTATIISSVLVACVLCESSYAFLSERNYEEVSCMEPEWGSIYKYLIFRALFLATLLPFTIILFLDVYIVIVIKRSRSFRAAVGSNQRGGEKPSRVDRATVSLVAVSLMAIVTLVPKALALVCTLLFNHY